MGDVYGGDGELRQEVAQLLARALAELRVEVAEGLVKEDDLGFGHEGTGQGHTLLLAAAELGGQAVLEPVELDELEDLLHAGLDLGLRDLADFQRVGHIAEHGHVGPYGIRLKHHPDPAALRGKGDAFVFGPDDVVADDDLAGVGGLKAGDAAEERGLAAPGGAQEGQDPVGRCGKGHVVKRCYLLVFGDEGL